MDPEILVWARPQALWLFLPWAVAVLARRRAGARSPAGEASPWAGAVDAALLPHVLVPPPAPQGSSGRALAAVLAALLILALAGPQVPRPGGPATPPVFRPDLARVLLVDLSPAFDARPEAERARLRTDLRRFARALPPGETALVVAAREAWLVVPPTEDVGALDAFLAELSAAAVPASARGDAPEAGLALARSTLAATGARRQLIYWLRVGPVDALPAPPPGAVLPVLLRPEAGAEAWIAGLGDAGSGAGWTRSLLNLAPPPDARRIDLGPFLALFALPFALVLARRPRGLVGLAAGLALTLAGPPDATADAFDDGVAHYRAGRYAEAAAAFADPAALRRDAARARHNLGNALARAGRLREALDAYDASLALRPGDPDTQHNRELVERLLRPPPPPSPPPPPPSAGQPPPPEPTPQAAEAARAAAQWLRRPPADAGGLLARKLALETARRPREER